MIRRGWLSVTAMMAALGLPARAQLPPLKVMSFNVRVPVDADGPHAWPQRRDLMVRTIRQQAPDVMGTQELTGEQGDYLAAHLPDYAWFGQGREGHHGDEHMGVFYRRDRLAIVKSGDFWLSDTPHVPGSRTWRQPYPRMVTWALFRRLHGGGRFYLFDTHFPYRLEDADARLRSAAELLRRIHALPGDVPVVVTGDFNCDPDSAVHARLTGTLRDAWVEAPSKHGPRASFHDFTGIADTRIDWILERGFKVLRGAIVTTHEGERYPSDHFPVVVELVPAPG